MKLTFVKLLMLCSTIAIVSCKNEQKPVEDNTVRDAETEEVVEEQTFSEELDILAEQTRIDWACSKPTATHTGTIGIKSGFAGINGNSLAGGEVVIDMSTITVTDLSGDMKASLEAHLKGTKEEKADDFFNINVYPEAKFVINKVVDVSNDSDFNVLVYGDLTMKDITKEIAFKAKSSYENGILNMESDEFSINRTDWGINFQSKKIFPQLKDKFIDDEVRLRLSMSATNNM